MNNNSKLAIAAFAAIAAVSLHAQTVTNALDKAGNYSGWPQTANNGYGFGNWTYNNTTPNGGFSGQFEGASGGINSGNGNAFGFYANSGANAQAQAIAPFSGGALMANQDFSVQMQNSSVTDNGGQVGFSLQNSSGNNIFQFYFNGGASDYYIKVWTSLASGVQIDTGVGYSSGPLTLSYAQGSTGNWTFDIYTGNTLAATLDSVGTGDLVWQDGISQANLYSLNGGSSRTMGDNGNLFFNNLQITTVPEPSTLAICGLSGLAAFFMTRRRR